MATSQPTNEHWKPVIGHEGSYEVSDQGRVRSLDRTATRSDGVRVHVKGRMLKPYTSKSGHKSVIMQVDGNVTRSLVHRLVLSAFVGECPDGMEACHWNDVPGDNRLENLRWATRRENNLDRVRNGKHPMSNKTHCKRGHEFTADNVRVEAHKNGFKRRCLACERLRHDERTRRARQYRLENPLPPRKMATHCGKGHEFTPENTYYYPNKKGRECKTCRAERVRRYHAKAKN